MYNERSFSPLTVTQNLSNLNNNPPIITNLKSQIKGKPPGLSISINNNPPIITNFKSSIKGKPPGLSISIENNNGNNNGINNGINNHINNGINNSNNLNKNKILFNKNKFYFDEKHNPIGNPIYDKITEIYLNAMQEINNIDSKQYFIKILNDLHSVNLFSTVEKQISILTSRNRNSGIDKFTSYTIKHSNKILKIYFFNKKSINTKNKIINEIIIQLYLQKVMNKRIDSNFNSSKITIKIPKIDKYSILDKEDFEEDFFNYFSINKKESYNKIIVFQMPFVNEAIPLEDIINNQIDKFECKKITQTIKFIDKKIKKEHIDHNDLYARNIFLSLENLKVNNEIIIYVIDFGESFILEKDISLGDKWLKKDKYTCDDIYNNTKAIFKLKKYNPEIDKGDTVYWYSNSEKKYKYGTIKDIINKNGNIEYNINNPKYYNTNLPISEKQHPIPFNNLSKYI
jgi:hypothetical protein